MNNERVPPQVDGFDLAKLGKSLDLLVKARETARLLEKERLIGGKGDKKKDSDFDPEEVREGVREEHEEHGGPVSVAHGPVQDGQLAAGAVAAVKVAGVEGAAFELRQGALLLHVLAKE